MTASPPSPTKQIQPNWFRPVELTTEKARKKAEKLYTVVDPVIREGFSFDSYNKVRPAPTLDSDRKFVTKPSNPSSKSRTNGTIRGVASWYCSPSAPICHYQYPPGSMVAAACGKLRNAMGPNWRGKTVTVTRGKRSVNVKLVDWCGHGSRVIDLYYEPMRRLGGTGLLNVTVSW